MHAEIRDLKLYFYPESIKEFQEIRLWVDINMPCTAYVYRPVQLLQELRQSLLTNDIVNQ